MFKSLRTVALLAVSAVALLATQQSGQAQDRVQTRIQPFVGGVPRLGFLSYFNGQGERVVRVTPNSRAWDIGLEPRDVIVAVNGVRIRYEGHWFDLMANAAARGHAVLSIRDCRTGFIVRRHIALGGGPVITAKTVRNSSEVASEEVISEDAEYGEVEYYEVDDE
jgi:hypothetical protein